MASSPATTTAVPETVAAARPLNPNVYRPVTPPHQSLSSHDGADTHVAAKFIVNTVGLLRVVAGGFAITLVALESDGRRQYNVLAKLFIALAFAQVFWLAFALLAQGSHRRRRGGSRRKGWTVDFGCVKCIFGRRGYDDDEDGDDDVLLGWVPGDAGKKWSRRGLLYTAADLAFAGVTFAVAMVAAKAPYCWRYDKHYAIAGIAFVVFALEVIIAVAQQFSILKRAKIQISYDDDEDEDDLGSHKYRIHLPQSPEQRHAVMSVAAQ